MDYHKAIILFLGCVTLITVSSSQQFHYVVLAPKIFRTDTNNTVTISASQVKTPGTVTLKLDYGDKNEIKTIHVEKDGVQQTNFVIPSQGLSSDVAMVYLDAHGADEEFPKHRQEMTLDSTSGYIMVQLDKPIYKPREHVKYRIMAVNEDQSPTKRSIRVEVIGPNDIILDSMVYPGEEAFDNKTFFLPKESQLGKWRITASYVGEKGSEQMEEFEVKEYVLPTFKVEIKPEIDIVMQKMYFININVEAKYSYGKDVAGDCSIRLGVLMDTDDNIPVFNISDTQLNLKLKKGKARFTIRKAEFMKSSLWFPVHGSRLYIEANVTEKSTGIQATAISTSTAFHDTKYSLQFSSKKQFKPGMPYRLQLEVKDTEANLKTNLLLHVNMSLYGYNNQKTNVENIIKSDVTGHCFSIIEVPEWCEKIKFLVSEVTTLDPLLHHQEEKEFEIIKTTKNRMSLADNTRHQDTSGFSIKVRYEHEEDRTMFVVVLSKGQMLYTTSFLSQPEGKSEIDIPDKYHRELSPFARFIVYYMDSDTSVKAESLIVHFPSRCLEELEITYRYGLTKKKILTPKKSFVVKVKGGNNMRVGLVAVDTAVYFLNNKFAVTREKMFSLLGKHDANSNLVESSDAPNTFKDNGLIYIDSHARREVDTGFRQGLMGRDSIYIDKVREYDSIPKEKIRKYFPESWNFVDFQLSSKGRTTATLTLPDTITTWQIQAVGLSSTRGVCVADPLRVTAFQLFFIQLHLPYKAVRLEQVKVVVSMFNYNKGPLEIKMNYTVDIGLCLPGGHQHMERSLGKRRSWSTDFYIIPLSTGDLTVTVAVWDISDVSVPELLDVVQKKLYVVPEGKRLRKTITLPLNPQGYQPNKRKEHLPTKDINISQTEKIDEDKSDTSNTQKTEVDLALPVEIIPGTEDCGIQACGDIMGDVITGALAGKGNIFVSSFHVAEEIIGNMAPAVHALQYLTSSGLLDKKQFANGRRFITLGVTRLMKYRNKNGGYSLYEGSEPVTWLTTLVLKTLCHAKNLSYVDDNLIDSGFLWLLAQVDDDGRPGNDQITSEDSLGYTVGLAAEILIALKECESMNMLKNKYVDEHRNLEIRMIGFIEENIADIGDTMTLSKMAYALMLSESPEVDWVLEKVTCKSNHSNGVIYWGDTQETSKPYWYRQSADAFTIETTAYALLAYIRHKKLEPHPLADWLIRQRNGHGGFVSPSDTAVAIQALAEFSSLTHTTTTDLRLEISSDQSKDYNHVLSFNTENAIEQKYVMDVPIGEKLLVKANGTGFGQVQVNVAYNVPTAPNDNCMYNLTVTSKMTDRRWDSNKNESGLCNFCSVGCTRVPDATSVPPSEVNASRVKKSIRSRFRKTSRKNRSRRGKKSRRKNRRHSNKKPRRSRQRGPVSRVTLCLEICVQYRGNTKSGPTRIEIDMLSGYEPIKEDLTTLKAMSSGKVRSVRDENGVVTVFLDEVPNNESLCVNFRIKERVEDNVRFRQPASVVVFQPSKPEEICLQNYDSVNKEKILPVYCIGEDNRYKGECACISGKCGKCTKKSLRISRLKNILCKADYLYKVNLGDMVHKTSAKHITASLDEISIKGSHNIDEGTELVFTTPQSCTCPRVHKGESVWVVGTNPYRFTNTNREELYRYVIDENTTFINITRTGVKGTTKESYFKKAESYCKESRNKKRR